MNEILIAISLGIIAGWFNVFKKPAEPYLNKISLCSLFIILLCLGAKIGCNSALLDKLGQLGGQALTIAVGTIVGSVSFLFFVIKFFKQIVSVENQGAYHD